MIEQIRNMALAEPHAVSELTVRMQAMAEEKKILVQKMEQIYEELRQQSKAQAALLAKKDNPSFSLDNPQDLKYAQFLVSINKLVFEAPKYKIATFVRLSK